MESGEGLVRTTSFKIRDVVIGNDVGIGYGATIMPGLKIQDGTVVEIRSVVTRDVRPYSMVAGNPAREIRRRFDDLTVERLLELRWWNWLIEKIRKNMRVLCSGDIEELLKLR